DNHNEFFDSYVKQFTDLPFLVTLTEHDQGGYYVPDKFVRAADLEGSTDLDENADTEGAAWKTIILDAATGRPVAPNGSLGFRWTESGEGRWNLDLGDVEPRLSLLGLPQAIGAEVLLPRFDTD